MQLTRISLAFVADLPSLAPIFDQLVTILSLEAAPAILLAEMAVFNGAACTSTETPAASERIPIVCIVSESWRCERMEKEYLEDKSGDTRPQRDWWR